MTAALALYPSYAVPPESAFGEARQDLTLVAAESAERFCGLLAKVTATGWGLPHLAITAQKLAEELITRAVETTGVAAPYEHLTELSHKLPPHIGIRLTHRGSGLLIEVWDSDPAAPSGVDVHLSNVADLGAEWSWYAADGGGKVIWAEVGVPAQRQHEPLPKRTAGTFTYPEPDQPLDLMRDPDILQQVRDGLHNSDTDRRRRGQL